MRQATSSYLNSIPPTSKDYVLFTLIVQMGATPLAALWVVEKKISRRAKNTIRRLEHA